MRYLNFVLKLGQAAAKYGPEVYELVELLLEMVNKFGPKAIDLVNRILADINPGSVSIMSSDSLAAENPELADFCDQFSSDGNEVTTSARGQILKRLAEFIKANPQLIGIIIGLLGEESDD